MTQKVLKLILFLNIFISILSENVPKLFPSIYKKDFSLLRNFTCAVVSDELKNNPEMRTIALIELESDFTPTFTRELFKCLPENIAKLIITPHTHYFKNNSIMLPKSSMIIYVGDEIRETDDFFYFLKIINDFFQVVSHLSKFIFLSTTENAIRSNLFLNKKSLAKKVFIFEKDEKIFVGNWWKEKIKTFKVFEGFRHKNLSQKIFANKVKNLEGFPIYVIFMPGSDSIVEEGKVYGAHKSQFIEVLAEKLNATLRFISVQVNTSSFRAIDNSYVNELITLGNLNMFDISLTPFRWYELFQTYFFLDYCFLVPLPPKQSIYELVLFLPLDTSCWAWLGITLVVSAIVWRIIEGPRSHWDFLYGMFTLFVGKYAKIKSSHFFLKLLFQILVLTLFVISNGYQGIVTSFMLKPVQLKLFRTNDELFESDLKIERDYDLQFIYRDNAKFQAAINKNRVGNFLSLNETMRGLNEYFDDLEKTKVARISSCSLKSKAQLYGDGESFRNFYIIPEVAFTSRDDLVIAPLSPYFDEFQEIMNKCFEAGLPKAWQIFHDIKMGAHFNFTRTRNLKEDKLILDFDAILPFFLILAFGFLLALFSLLCEIFYHDFVSQLTKKYLAKLFRRKFKISNVRRVVVMPRKL